MKADETVDVVWRMTRSPYGESVIALFPGIAGTSDPSECLSYVRLGQHGAADYTHVIRNSRPATPAEYAALERELTSPPFGYVFRVVKRETAKHRAARREQVSR